MVLIGEQSNASRSLENPVRKMDRLLAQLHWLHEPDLAWPMLLAFLAAEQEEPAAGSCGSRIVDAAMSRPGIALLLQQCYGQAGLCRETITMYVSLTVKRAHTPSQRH